MPKTLVELQEALDNDCCFLPLPEMMAQLLLIMLAILESTEEIEIDVDKLPGFWIPENDYVSVAYPLATREVYTFKTGGSGGTIVATVTINYTDATKEFLSDADIVRV